VTAVTAHVRLSPGSPDVSIGAASGQGGIDAAMLAAIAGVASEGSPPAARFSGHDGMSATAGIVRDGARHLVRGGLLALEVDERRASLAAELMMRHGAYSNVGVVLDLAGRERFVFASRC
jgi:release factor glutamine methyltransferase